MLWVRVIKHSFLQVSQNFVAALKVSVVLWVVCATISAMAVQWILIGGYDSGVILYMREFLWLITVFQVMISVLIAVSWHRFVLNNERPTSWLPKMPLGLTAKYIWKMILIALLLMVLLIPVIFVYVFGFTNININDIPRFAFNLINVMAFLVMVIGSYLFLRLSVLLPAAAMRRAMKIGEAWSATSSLGMGLWIIAFIIAVLHNILQAGAIWLYSITGGNIIWSVVGWFALMIGVSLVTTIYGYCVEKRELV